MATKLSNRADEIIRFYALLDEAAKLHGGPQRLASMIAHTDIPNRGVYFFQDDSEPRNSGTGARVVRVGTHALKADARSTLKSRLSSHRGTAGGGNHRASVFRLLVGAAMSNRDPSVAVATWGKGNTAPISVTAEEARLEDTVSQYLARLSVICLNVDDEPGPDSRRGYIERNAIALLSNFGRDSDGSIDVSSPDWLGRYTNDPRVIESGLWNRHHVDEPYGPAFLDIMEGVLRKAPALRMENIEMPSWSELNNQIAQCRRSADPVACLRALRDRYPKDGMVAKALGDSLEKQGRLQEALEMFVDAKRLLPLEQYKQTARAAADRVRNRLSAEGQIDAQPLSAPCAVPTASPMSDVLHIVSCSKRKIWDEDPSASQYVPARQVYKGDWMQKWLGSGLADGGARWLILSAKYGFIEPDHPIAQYDVTFSKDDSGPMSVDALRAQVEHQTRWSDTVRLTDFREVCVWGSSLYCKMTAAAFMRTEARVYMRQHDDDRRP